MLRSRVKYRSPSLISPKGRSFDVRTLSLRATFGCDRKLWHGFYFNLFLLFFFFTVTGSYAQDFKSDIAKMKDSYLKIKNLSMNVEISVYENSSSDGLLAKKTASLKKSEDNYCYEMEDIVMLMNEKYSVLVYKADRQIIYSARNSSDEKKAAYTFAAPGLDSAFQKYDSVVYKGIRAGLKEYVIYTSKSIIERTDLLINGAGDLISKVVYYYNKEKVASGNKVSVEYKAMDLSPVFQKETFSEKNFFAGTGDKAVSVKQYKGYAVKEVTDDDL